MIKRNFFLLWIFTLGGVYSARGLPISAPIPSANELDLFEEFFVIPNLSLPIASTSGTTSLTQPIFFDLPDTASPSYLFSIIGNVSFFDSSSIPLDSSKFFISQILVADDFDFFSVPFAAFDFNSELTVTITDSFFGDTVTYFAGTPTQIFAIQTDEAQDYGLVLEITGIVNPLPVGSDVRFGDAEGRRPVPEPSSLQLMIAGLLGVVLGLLRRLQSTLGGGHLEVAIC